MVIIIINLAKLWFRHAILDNILSFFTEVNKINTSLGKCNAG